MFRKNSKRVSIKKRSPVPAPTVMSKAPPKKAAETVEITPPKTNAVADPQPKAPPAEKQIAAAPVRVAAAETVVNAANQAEVSAAIAALRDGDADVARDAATTLGRLGNRSAVEPLIEALSNGSGYFHCVVRAAAAASLGQLHDQRALPALRNAVRDEMAEASAEAVRALTALGDPQAVVEFIDIARNPTGYFLRTVRLAAVVGLIKLGGDQARAELARIAADDSEDPVIRETASRGL
jgi:HEAT repeat protein